MASAPLPGTGEFTRLLDEMREDDLEAADELLPCDCHDLRTLVTANIAHEAPGQTTQLTLAAHRANDELFVADEALDHLAGCELVVSKLANPCYFVELALEQAAKELVVSISTVKRSWAFARERRFRETRKKRKPPVKLLGNRVRGMPSKRRRYEWCDINSECEE
jgi:hypothetical protein